MFQIMEYVDWKAKVKAVLLWSVLWSVLWTVPCPVWSLLVDTDPTVSTMYGDVQGVTMEVQEGVTVHQFLGIPYAAPPMGNLRFLPPRPPESWSEPFNATAYGNVCMQSPSFFPLPRPDTLMSEDCLNLNIYVPLAENSTGNEELFSVVVFIHGGDLRRGAGSWYDMSFFAHIGNVIVVTINYRLELFGFLSTGDDVISGNMGFLDQIEALKWVRDNIGGFGGDSDSVTVFGHSSGGESVLALMLSPKARNLFQRAIVFSPRAAWEYPDSRDQQQPFRDFSALVNCSADRSARALRCLQELPAETLLASNFPQRPKLLDDVGVLVKDGDFLDGSPRDLWQAGKFHDVDLIIGFSALDGDTILGTILQNYGSNTTAALLSGLPTPPNQPNAILEAAIHTGLSFQTQVKPTVYPALDDAPTDFNSTPNFNTLMAMISNKYFPTEVASDPGLELAAVLRLLTVSVFGAYGSWVADTVSKHTSSHLYMHHFSYKSDFFRVPGRILDTPAGHGEDAYYFVGAPLNSEIRSGDSELDKNISLALINVLSSFAKNGRPMSGFGGVQWPTYDADHKMYWDFNGDSNGAGVNASAVMENDVMFWNDIITPLSQQHSQICNKEKEKEKGNKKQNFKTDLLGMKENEADIAVIALSGGGFLLLIILVITCCCFCQERRSSNYYY